MKLVLLILSVLSVLAIAQNVSTPQPTTPEAQTRLGNDYLDKKDYSSAMIWFRKAAEQSNPVAENNIGWLYEGGLGVKQDYAEASNWFRKAASQGYAEAQNNIGWLYQNGWGVKQDYGDAMAWYRKAAEQNNAQAERHIGSLYEKGLGVPQDQSEAEAWYKKASDHALLPGGIRPPRPIYSPEPEYSKEAGKTKYQGICVLSAVIGPDGNPRDIKVVKPLGMGLDEKAIDTVKTWRFEPGMKDGVPVATQVNIEVTIRLY